MPDLTVHGVGVPYNRLSQNLGGYFERIHPAAVQGMDTSELFAVLNHDVNHIGAAYGNGSLRLRDTAEGLMFEASLSGADGSKIFELVDSGMVTRTSFAFYIAQDEWSEVDSPDDKSKIALRTIRKIRKLDDVSPVAHPAYLDSWVKSGPLPASIGRRTLPARPGMPFPVAPNPFAAVDSGESIPGIRRLSGPPAGVTVPKLGRREIRSLDEQHCAAPLVLTRQMLVAYASLAAQKGVRVERIVEAARDGRLIDVIRLPDSAFWLEARDDIAAGLWDDVRCATPHCNQRDCGLLHD